LAGITNIADANAFLKKYIVSASLSTSFPVE
jgi:hypothetical protein